MHKKRLYILTAPSFLPSSVFVMVLHHHVFVFPVSYYLSISCIGIPCIILPEMEEQRL